MNYMEPDESSQAGKLNIKRKRVTRASPSELMFDVSTDMDTIEGGSSCLDDMLTETTENTDTNDVDITQQTAISQPSLLSSINSLTSLEISKNYNLSANNIKQTGPTLSLLDTSNASLETAVNFENSANRENVTHLKTSENSTLLNISKTSMETNEATSSMTQANTSESLTILDKTATCSMDSFDPNVQAPSESLTLSNATKPSLEIDSVLDNTKVSKNYEQTTASLDDSCEMEVDKSDDGSNVVDATVNTATLSQSGKDSARQSNNRTNKTTTEPENNEEIPIKKRGRPKNPQRDIIYAREMLPLLPERGQHEFTPENLAKLKKYFDGKKYIRCPKAGCKKNYDKFVSFRYHVVRCGNTSKFACPVCDKLFTAENGLNYHTKHVHRAKDEDEETEEDDEPEELHASMEVQNEVDNANEDENENDSENKNESHASRYTERYRRALQRSKHTQKRLNGAKSEAKKDDKTTKGHLCTTFKYSEYIKVVEQNESTSEITNEDWEKKIEECLAQFRNHKRKRTTVQCPKNCGYAPRKISNFHKHIAECKGKQRQRYVCTLCTDNRIFSSLAGIKGHITGKHFNDEEEKPESGEDTKKRNIRVYHSNSVHKNFNYEQRTKEWYKACHSIRVFEGLKPTLDSWKKLPECEIDEYLPLRRTSPPFRIHKLENDSTQIDDISDYRLPIFASTKVDSNDSLRNLFFNVGGPVWAMDWVPTPADEKARDQYIAIACHRDPEKEHLLSENYKENGVLQIWCLPGLKNKKHPKSCAKFRLGIAYDYGPIWDIKWCPSGAWEQAPQAPEDLRRLGLLAIACSDGKVRIISVPSPDSLLDKINVEDKDRYQNLIFRVTPVLELSPGSSLRKYRGECGTVWSVAWQPDHGHSKIIAGFNDGTVGLWNLTTQNSLLRSSSESNLCQTIFPYSHFQAHCLTLRCLVWCPSDSNYFATTGYDRLTKFWDIRNTSQPIADSSNIIGINCEFSWPLHGAVLVYSSDVISGLSSRRGTRAFEYHYKTNSNKLIHRSSAYVAHNSTTWDNDYSNWSSTLASIDASGELVYVIFGKFHKKNYTKTNRRPICRTVVEGVQNPSAEDDREENETENEQSGEQNKTTDQKAEASSKKEYKLIFQDVHPITVRKGIRDQLNNDMPPNNYDRSTPGALHKVRWNPNHTSYEWLATGGKAGLIRIINVGIP